MGTILLVYLSGSQLKSKTAGFFAALLLLSISEFSTYHGARTGDYDSGVTFFIVLAIYLFVLYEKRG